MSTLSSLWQDPPAPAPVDVPAARSADRLRPARQRPLIVDVLAGAAGLGLGITIGLAVTAESSGSLSASIEVMQYASGRRVER